jgi:tetratricopeptide (TPR) repeat protein
VLCENTNILPTEKVGKNNNDNKGTMANITTHPQGGSGSDALGVSRTKFALVPSTAHPLGSDLANGGGGKQGGGGGEVMSMPRDSSRTSGGKLNTTHNALRGTPRSGRRAQPHAPLLMTEAAPLLSPRHLRDIGKYVDSNIRIPHAHRVGGGGGQLAHIIPQCPFVQTPAFGDALLKVSIAAIHPRESALDVPLRLTCPEQYHSPPLVDPRSNGTVAGRIVALLKGGNSIPVHHTQAVGGGEGLADGSAAADRGEATTIARLNAIRDSEMRAAAANRAQRFDKEAQALIASGALQYNSGNMEGAVRSFGTAVQRFEVTGDAQGVAYAHNVLGVCYYRLQEYKMALVHHKKQQVLSAAYGKAVAQINLGVTYSALNEHVFAEQAFQDGYQSALEAQDSVLETISLGNLGLTYMRLGDVRKSQTNLELCLEHCSIAGDRVGSAVCLLLLGEIYSVVDDPEHALFYYEHAFRVAGEASVSDLQELARVSIGVTRGNQQAKSSLSTVARSLGQDVGLAELLLSLPHQ